MKKTKEVTNNNNNSSFCLHSFSFKELFKRYLSTILANKCK